LVVVHVQALAHDHVVPGGGRRLVEALLGVTARELGQRGLEPAAGFAQRRGALALELLLDRRDGVVAAHSLEMTRSGTIVSRGGRLATAAGSAGTVSPDAGSSSNPASLII